MYINKVVRLGDSSVTVKFNDNQTPSPSQLLPGSGFTGDTTKADVVDPSFTMAGDASSVVRWGLAPYQVVGDIYGDTIEVSVVAAHYNGIKEVGFIADGGDEVKVSSPTAGPDGIEEYRVMLNATTLSPGDTVEVRAIAYPNHGVPRILQGEIQPDNDIDETRKEGLFGLKVTKIGGIRTINVTSGTSIKQAFSDAGSDSNVQAAWANNDEQVRLVFSDSEVEGESTGDSSWFRSASRLVPTIIEGSIADRGVHIQNVDFGVTSLFAVGSYHLKNLTWDLSTVTLRASSSTRRTYHYIENCTLTSHAEIIPDTYSFKGQTFSGNFTADKSSSVATYVRATRQGFDPVVASFSNDIGDGIYIEDSNLDTQVSHAVMWVRNCVSDNTDNDVSHHCVLNLDIRGASFGYEKIYPIIDSSVWWQPNTDFVDGSRIIVIVDGAYKSYKNTSGSTINTATFNASDWNDGIWPHIDGWQERANQDGTSIIKNTWIEGMTTDNNSSLQPYFYRTFERLEDIVWKRWNITNQTSVNLSKLSQVIHHCHHWIMDRCVWNDAGTSGELRIVSSDTSNLRGWGHPDGTGDSLQDIGCKYAKWINSEVNRFTASGFDSDFSLSGADAIDGTPTLTEFSTFVNNQTGWDIDIDQYTIDNSSPT